MIKVTDSKTIIGRILKVGRSQQYCTHWGEMLFKGREVIVIVRRGHKRLKIPMYIRDDSDIGILRLASSSLSGKEWNITIHGEMSTTTQGCLFVDRIGLSALVANQVNINKYF